MYTYMLNYQYTRHPESSLQSLLPGVFVSYFIFHVCLQQLTQELETERERRWKAEQAARKLTDHIRDLQGKGGSQSRAGILPNFQLRIGVRPTLERDISHFGVG